MVSLQQRNYRFAGLAFMATSLMFFMTDNTALGATFIALGAVFVSLSAQGGKKDGE